ncbi:MAG: DUF1573 domain-containing protein, partial [Chitinivibrionales bacterium]|nr:DUF1573 domain-containing protein [Chitinivibrionales bacterium]
MRRQPSQLERGTLDKGRSVVGGCGSLPELRAGRVRPILLVLSLWTAVLADGLPSFMSTSYELDTLIHGDTVALAYPFVNTTGDSLVVDELRASCGCVSSIDGGSRYGPGDTGVVVITFASSGQR